MTPEIAAPLREALLAADFGYDAVGDLLGEDAHRALSRNETTPARRRTALARTPLATLVDLFLLQRPVPEAAAEAALPGLVDRLAAAGLLERSVSEVAARLDCRPYATAEGEELWVVSDLTPGLDGAPTRVGPDHVLGISSASTSLAQLTLREPVARALDLGTGCGVQALHLADHSDLTVATDVNPRALAIARFNMALNEVADRVEVRDGSFFAAVADERFDLIATNPPFVISPATGALRDGSSLASSGTEFFMYRDSGLPGDQIVEHIVRTAPDHLADGGWCQVLANWVITDEQPWDERLGEWLPAGCDALVVQREVLDPAAYVELWLKDSGHHPATGGPRADHDDYLRRYDTWLGWLEEERVAGIGFGWINLHRTGTDAPEIRELLDWPYEVEQPVAPAIGDWAGAVAAAAGLSPDALLVTREDVRQETIGPAGAADPATIVLRQQRGLRRARQVDTVLAAAVGACDGDLPIGTLLGAVAELLGEDPDATRERYLPEVAGLVREGFLTTAGGSGPGSA